jgi:dephospho-CoA kinase
VDSVRAPAEVAVLRRCPGFHLLGVTAPLELRWRREIARGREGVAHDLETFRGFEERENQDQPDSQQLRRTLDLADAVVVNDGDLDQLRARVLTIVDQWGRADGTPRS